MLQNFLRLPSAPVGNLGQAGAIRQQFPSAGPAGPVLAPCRGLVRGNAAYFFAAARRGPIQRGQREAPDAPSSAGRNGRPCVQILCGVACAGEMLVNFAQVHLGRFGLAGKPSIPNCSIQKYGVSLTPRLVVACSVAKSPQEAYGQGYSGQFSQSRLGRLGLSLNPDPPPLRHAMHGVSPTPKASGVQSVAKSSREAQGQGKCWSNFRQ